MWFTRNITLLRETESADLRSVKIASDRSGKLAVLNRCNRIMTSSPTADIILVTLLLHAVINPLASMSGIIRARELIPIAETHYSTAHEMAAIVPARSVVRFSYKLNYERT